MSLVYFHALSSLCFFFFNDTATTEIYTLSLHDALPISAYCERLAAYMIKAAREAKLRTSWTESDAPYEEALLRSEEHTSELQSPCNLVCRLLLEKKKKLQEHTCDAHLQQDRTPDCIHSL